jgi:hypothetical protein
MATSSVDLIHGHVESEASADVAFLLLDGVRRPRAAHPEEVVLCALGLTREGAVHPLALRAAASEDERAWRALLRDLKTRGVTSDLLLICCDGHPALVKAIHAIYPDTPLQISVAHRLLALARKVDPRWRAVCLAEARQIFAAPDRAVSVARFREWHVRWLKRGELAVRSLEADLASCLTYYRFPAHLWSRIRTVNLVERVFRDARRTAPPASPAAIEEWEEIADAEESPQRSAVPAAIAPEPHPDDVTAEQGRGRRRRRGVAANGPVTESPVTSGPVANGPAPTGPTTNGPIVNGAFPIGPVTSEAPLRRALDGDPIDNAGTDRAGVGPVQVIEPALVPELQRRKRPSHLPSPHLVDLTADTEFMQWLNGYRYRGRMTRHMKIVVALTSLAGLMGGLLLARGW